MADTFPQVGTIYWVSESVTKTFSLVTGVRESSSSASSASSDTKPPPNRPALCWHVRGPHVTLLLLTNLHGKNPRGKTNENTSIIRHLSNDELLKYLIPIEPTLAFPNRKCIKLINRYVNPMFQKHAENHYLILIKVIANANNRYDEVYNGNFSKNDLIYVHQALEELENQTQMQILNSYDENASNSTSSLPKARCYTMDKEHINYESDSAEEMNSSICCAELNKNELVVQWICQCINNTIEDVGELNQPNPRWMPLEGNPQVLNQYLKNLGVENEDYEFVEIIDLDEDSLALVPQPVSAVLLIFPITEQHEKNRRQEYEEASQSAPDYCQSIYFLKQFVGNACGSIAVIHSIANNLEKFKLDQHKPLAQFLETTNLMTPEQRAEHLKHASDIATANDIIAEEGELHVIDRDEHVNLHFVCFINVNNELYELDGRHPHPIKHKIQGEKQGEPFDLLRSTKDVILRLIESGGGDIRFSIMALTKVQ